MEKINNLLGNGAVAACVEEVARDNPTTLFNCAGIAHPSQTTPNNIERENLHIERVIELSQSYERVVHISSPAVLGNQDTFDEDSNYLSDVTPYGLHKRAIEGKLLNTISVKLIIGRLFSLTSKDLKKQLVYDAIIRIKSGDVIFKVDKQQYRCFVSAADFRGMISFALNKQLSGIINLTNTKSTNLVDAITYIANRLNYSGELTFVPNVDVKNYSSIVSTSSKLFSNGYILKDVGLEALDEVIRYHEN